MATLADLLAIGWLFANGALVEGGARLLGHLVAHLLRHISALLSGNRSTLLLRHLLALLLWHLGA